MLIIIQGDTTTLVHTSRLSCHNFNLDEYLIIVMKIQLKPLIQVTLHM